MRSKSFGSAFCHGFAEPKIFLLDSIFEVKKFWVCLLSRDKDKDLSATLFTSQQRQAHKRFMDFAFSRQPILNSLAKKSFENPGPHGCTGLPFTNSDYETLTHIIGSNISPAFSYIGKYWFHVWGTLVIIGLLKLLLEIAVQMYLTARHQGCGRWICMLRSWLPRIQ